MAYIYPRYKYVSPVDLNQEVHHPVVIVGAGLVGLTLALDLAKHSIKTVVIDEGDTVSEGSRAIVFAKRSLEIFGRLGLGERLLEKGVSWHVGRIFSQDKELYEYNFMPEDGHEFPAFLNLQQYYIEQWLIEACQASRLVDIRWKTRASGIESSKTGAVLDVETPDGQYRLKTDWLLACDGAHSFVRNSLGLHFIGKEFPSRFLIADIVMKSDFAAERRFWFNPPFHPGHSVLLHKQPDNVWRVDFQLGNSVDPTKESRPESVIPRLKAMFGPHTDFSLDWVSVYSFRCRRIQRFVHDRVVFVGDSAHQVSPFGGRGGNGGIQDADNLAWKIALVLQEKAPTRLIESYNEERVLAADENILNSTRSAEFITPTSEGASALREAILILSQDYDFARRMANSGRLSQPAVLNGCSFIQGGGELAIGNIPVGSPALDAPVECEGKPDWLLHHIKDNGFTLIEFHDDKSLKKKYSGVSKNLEGSVNRVLIATCRDVPQDRLTDKGIVVLNDAEGLVEIRYGMPAGSVMLLRPDQHIAAVFEEFDRVRIEGAVRRACGYVDNAIKQDEEKIKPQLVTDLNVDDPDAIFSLLSDAHEGLGDEASSLLNAQIVLMLANHLGDTHIVEEAIRIASNYVRYEKDVSIPQYG